jgi:hypothetical protein
MNDIFVHQRADILHVFCTFKQRKLSKNGCICATFKAGGAIDIVILLFTCCYNNFLASLSLLTLYDQSKE